MESAEILERERRWATPAAALGVIGVALALIGFFGTQLNHKNDRLLLDAAHTHSMLIPLGIVEAVGFLLLTVPFVYLFLAAQARSEKVRGPMIIFNVIGPALIAAQIVVLTIVVTHLGNEFANGKVTTGKEGVHAAHHLIQGSTGWSVSEDLLLPAALALIVAMTYTSLQAMRVGLLSRFAGSFGIALGVSIVFFGVLLPLFWLLYVSLLIGGWLPTARPPAWAAGEAIPWPTPGERMAEQLKGQNGDEGAEDAPNPPREPGERRKRKRRA